MIILSDEMLLESKSVRENQLKNISHDCSSEILNKVKSLMFALWEGTGIATTEQIKDFYEVSVDTIHASLKRHKDELTSDGVKVIRGSALRDVSDIVSVSQRTPKLTVWTPRAALRVGMLLRDSSVAKAVRTALLDLVEKVVPAQAIELERLRLENENLHLQVKLSQQNVELSKENNIYLERLNLLTCLHGLPGTMALLGRPEGFVEVEKPTIEVIDEKHNVSIIGQTLKQVKDYLKKRYGLNFKSGSQIKSYLEQLGQEGLIAQTKRSVLADYIPEENLEVVYQILTGGARQLLLGE